MPIKVVGVIQDVSWMTNKLKETADAFADFIQGSSRPQLAHYNLQTLQATYPLLHLHRPLFIVNKIDIALVSDDELVKITTCPIFST